MKKLNLVGTLVLSFALAAGLSGCAHKTGVTPIPDVPMGSGDHSSPPPTTGTPSLTPVIGGGEKVNTPDNPTASSTSIPLDNGKYATLFDGPNTMDDTKFKADTIYFDFDSASIKDSEASKLQEVASYFKDNPRFEGLIIQGNCDERGTEKYNLSLGERRALAAREYLANLGVKPERIKTITFGASRPAETSHDEAAWKKNRRDEFILVTPK